MKLRGADLLARTLAAAGARKIFSLSGNHVMPVFDAAIEAKLDMIHVRHEAATVHMADAWGRLTGQPGIALVTGGPGHANAVGALYTALASDSPMVLISGHAPLNELGKGAFQEMRQADIAAPLCKLSFTAQSVETLSADVARALRESVSGRPGPVHLSVPNDVLDAVVEAEAPAPFQVSLVSSSLGKEVLEKLVKAERPLVVTGRFGVPGLEAATGIPVIAMESPRGVNDPSLGRVAKVLAKADVVLLAGKRRDFTLKFGKAFAPQAQVFEAESSLLSFPKGTSGKKSDWLAEVREAVSYRPPEWKSIAARANAPLHAVALCRALESFLAKPDAILVSDGGEFGQWAQACLSAPRRVINGPAGSIGSALPLAAAAKVAFPQAPVLAMTGDGSFGFHLSELDTAVRYGLDYLVVIGNDSCWNAEYQIQLRAYGKARAHGLDLLPTRYGAVAAALGAHGEDVADGAALEPALARARSAGRVACVNVAIERVAAPSY